MKVTTPNQTMTSEGLIPHKTIGPIKCPVMLDVDAYESVATLNKPHVPMRHKGKLMFVIPGGKFILGD